MYRITHIIVAHVHGASASVSSIEIFREGRSLLASLLPGLRDIRVPLTVGYLWLLNLWMWFADKLPNKRPAGDGPIARAFDLSELLGTTFIVAGISFGAYLLGAVLVVPNTLNVFRRIDRFPGLMSSDARETGRDFDILVSSMSEFIEHKSFGLRPDEMDDVNSEADRAARTSSDSLRPRLLVANQDLYGEYDRLAAEASFRINVSLPLLSLGVTASVLANALWIAIVMLPLVAALLYTGLRRQTASVSVIQRAVLNGTITHPIQDMRDRWK